MMEQSILSFLIFWPVVLGVMILGVGNRAGRAVEILALVGSLIEFFASLALWWLFEDSAGFQLVVQLPWIERFGISYHIGIDGISLPLILLTTLIGTICVWSSFTAIKERRAAYYASFMFLTAAAVGTFCALDVFLFYVFWEAMLIPMYFIIGVWGGANRIYATVKFVLYTLAGSLLMLVAIIVMHNMTAGAGAGSGTFDLLAWYGLELPLGTQKWLFAAFAVAFLIKVPLFPFHTWLPDAHVEAPAAGSIFLAGILLKMGTYGMMRFAAPLFPEAFAYFADALGVLAVIGIVYGALMALAQTDIKSLVAYSSVSHMGFIILGLIAYDTIAAGGALLQQINHGISTGALFLLVGIIYERTHTRMIADYGGLFKIAPAYTVAFLIVMLSSIGLPGTNGFVGEFLILIGTYKAQPTLVIIAATGVILAAVYMLYMVRRVFYGAPKNPGGHTPADLTMRERWCLAPLVILIFAIGLYPNFLLEKMEPTLDRWVEQIKTSAYAAPAERTDHGLIVTVSDGAPWAVPPTNPESAR